ncbi:hypothetical protein [Paraburkholderia hospita]|uniref:hypothetical protein n=1 Tax=Paraburkholderia hospita TaxID=169430 RepID=UPI001055978F|nr:hypothetical protein [Paraburkholderia hospita]
MMDLYVTTVPYIVQFDENVVCARVAAMSAVAKAEAGWFITSALCAMDFGREHAISCHQGLFKALRHRGFRHSLSLRLDLCGLTHINYWRLASGASATCSRAINARATAARSRLDELGSDWHGSTAFVFACQIPMKTTR